MATSPSATPCRFLDIPAELRLSIYEHLFAATSQGPTLYIADGKIYRPKQPLL